MTIPAYVTADVKKLYEQVLGSATAASGRVSQLTQPGFTYRLTVRNGAGGKVLFESGVYRIDAIPTRVDFFLPYFNQRMYVYLTVFYCDRYAGSVVSGYLRLVVLTPSEVQQVVNGQGFASIGIPAAKNLKRTAAWIKVHTEVRRKSSVGRNRASKPRSSPPLNPWVTYALWPWTDQWYDGSSTRGSTSCLVDYHSWSSVDTPDYRKRLANKETLPINPHNSFWRHTSDFGYIRDDRMIPDAAGSHVYIDAVQNRFGAEFGSGPPALVFNNAGRNRAIKKLAGEAGTDMNNVAVDLAEIGQTVSMVKFTAERLAQSIMFLKHGNVPKAIASLGLSSSDRRLKGISPRRTTAENWLQLQYGWKPLLADLKGVIDKTLASMNENKASVLTMKSSARVTTTDESRLAYLGQPYKIGMQTVIKACTSKFMVRYRHSNAQLSFMAQLGFTNPVDLAWELLPYSFVVDWFLPIGPLLESLSSFDGLAFMDGYEIQFTRQVTIIDLNYHGYPFRSYGSGPDERTLVGSYLDERVSYNRIKLLDFPGVSLPSFKDPIGVAHALNALSLLSVAFGSKK